MVLKYKDDDVLQYLTGEEFNQVLTALSFPAVIKLIKLQMRHHNAMILDLDPDDENFKVDFAKMRTSYLHLNNLLQMPTVYELADLDEDAHTPQKEIKREIGI